MAEVFCGIYKITNPSGKVYIGKSVDIYHRWKQYVGLRCEKQRILYNSLKKYGVSNHTFEIIHLCDEAELNRLEKYYVDIFQSFNSDHGMNIRDGGGCRGRHSDETKRLMSEASKGQKKTPEAIEKQRATMTGRKLTPEHCRKISEGNMGRVFSEESRRKMSLRHTGKKMSKESVDKMIQYRRGRKHSEQHRQNISLGLKNTNHLTNKPLPLMVVDLETGESVIFKSMTDAARQINLTRQSIGRILKGQSCSKRYLFSRAA